MIRYFLHKFPILLLIIAIFSAIISSFVLVKSEFYQKDIFIALFTILAFLFHLQVVVDYNRKKPGALKYLLLGEVYFLWMIITNFIYYSYELALYLWMTGIVGMFLYTRNIQKIYVTYFIYFWTIAFLQWYIFKTQHGSNIFSDPILFTHLLWVSIGSLLIIIIRGTSKKDNQKMSMFDDFDKISPFYTILWVIILYIITGGILYYHDENIFQKIWPNIIMILSIITLYFSHYKKYIPKYVSFFSVFLLYIILHFSFLDIIHPTNEKPWIVMFKKIPYTEVMGNMVRIHNIRNFRYKNSYEFEANWYDKELDVDTITSVDYMVNPFALEDTLAHIFLSFGFADGSYLSISIEGRRTTYQYSNWDIFRWNFKQFEKIYMIADERDILVLRGAIRKNWVYRYPLPMSKKAMQELFLDLLQTGNNLKENPEFITPINNCTRVLWDKHINKVLPKPFSITDFISTFSIYSWNSDRFIYNKWFIEKNEDFETIKNKSLINDSIQKYKDDPDFSKKIRAVFKNE